MKQPVWIAFDLGVRGDFQGMYQFLDSLNAKECGDSVAFLQFEFEEDLLGELKKNLKKHVNLDKRSRVYIIFPGNEGKPKGRFVIGNRKRAPWIGLGSTEPDQEDEGE